MLSKSPEMSIKKKQHKRYFGEITVLFEYCVNKEYMCEDFDCEQFLNDSTKNKSFFNEKERFHLITIAKKKNSNNTFILDWYSVVLIYIDTAKFNQKSN